MELHWVAGKLVVASRIVMDSDKLYQLFHPCMLMWIPKGRIDPAPLRRISSLRQSITIKWKLNVKVLLNQRDLVK